MKNFNMNIIQAIQQAENGKLITNGDPLFPYRVLKYIQGGVFFEYIALDGHYTQYKYEVRSFSMAEILSTNWHVVDIKINELPFNYKNENE